MQGRLSAWLVKHGIIHRSLGFDYRGIETLQIKAEVSRAIAIILYVYGYNYLRSQCAYDVAPGGLLASVYHLTRIEYGSTRRGMHKSIYLKSSSLLFSGAQIRVDFQERESYDMIIIGDSQHIPLLYASLFETISALLL